MPNPISAPSLILILLHPVTLSLSIEPDAPSKLRVAEAASVVSAVRLPTLAPLKVTFPESAASVNDPLIVAPLSTTTLSQPVRPAASTLGSSPPLPRTNLSVSTPGPPSITVTSEKPPPANTRLSDPRPSLTSPATEAPVFTVTVASPRVSVIARRPFWPTEAPLASVMRTAEPPVCETVRMAAAPTSAPPMTEPETLTSVSPPPSRSRYIPSCVLPSTSPDATTDTSAPPLAVTLMPVRRPSTAAAATVTELVLSPPTTRIP